ncbi:beta-glucoside-specific PTS transporter subunit IIABC [Limosilactobacillus reuteri]|uniref:beta-glucoside-specific PTS transporter subunit IIABC n=1 Tax=Limosilactobacillus reuteri TaxID=1598 RepID=UPI00128D6AD7|nr:beta-glucoside-specific PTS transporter subunit IIABC [Limosilactobacillus reuteri]MQB97795.1 PTS beta-glucoside transporter subunit IIBCA [Limosilactobacillus reuteri]
MTNYESSAKQIVNYVGGRKNISNLIHCSTRLRFSLVDFDQVNLNKLKNVDGVLNAVTNSGQCQVVVGNDVMEMYDAVTKLTGDLNNSDQTATKEKQGRKKQGWLHVVLDYMVAIFQPLIPAIAGGGVLRSFLMLFAMLGWMSEKSTLYQVLNFVGTAPVYFLPLLVAVTTAQKLRVNVLVAMSTVSALVLPDFVTAMGKGVNLLGVHLTNVDYSTQAFPAILAVFFYAGMEKLVTKYSPKAIRVFFVPMVSMAVTYLVTLVVLGPFGYYVGTGLTAVIMFLYQHFGFLAMALLAAALPIMVSTGMHKALYPYVLPTLSSVGHEMMYVPASLAHNMSESGMSFAVAVRTKDPKLRATALSAGISALFGITEPAVYGVTLQHKRAMGTVMASSFVGAGIIGLLGIKAFAPVGPGLASLSIFADKTDPSNLYKAIVMFFVSLLMSFVLGLFVWKDETTTDRDDDRQKDSEQSFGDEQLSTPVAGTVMPLSAVNDEVFSKGTLGKGVAVSPTQGKLVAPTDGTVMMVYKTGHALGMKTKGGSELLFHIGLDTVNLKGKYFTPKVKQGDKVKRGDTLIEFDLDKIKAAGYDPTTMMVVTNRGKEKLKFPRFNENTKPEFNNGNLNLANA